jgi:hypothetical protein
MSICEVRFYDYLDALLVVHQMTICIVHSVSISICFHELFELSMRRGCIKPRNVHELDCPWETVTRRIL